MNIAKMMKQAAEMQSKMKAIQAELSERTIEESVGGGAVTVTANGAGDVSAIKIDPAIVDPADVEALEDLVLAGVNAAISKAKEGAAAEMAQLTEGLGLPPGLGL